MGKIYATVDGDVRIFADTPRGAGKITKAIDRGDYCFIKRRNVESGTKMRQMMFDPMHLTAEAFGWEAFPQMISDATAGVAVRELVNDETDIRAAHYRVGNLPQQVRPAVLIDADVLHLAQLQLSLPQTVGDGLRWKTRPVLHAPEALLLCRRDKLPVAHERRR